MKTKEILNEREKTHGDFERFADLIGDATRFATCKDKPGLASYFGCCKCNKYKKENDIAWFNVPGFNEYTVTCKECAQVEEPKEECKHENREVWIAYKDAHDPMSGHHQYFESCKDCNHAKRMVDYPY